MATRPLTIVSLLKNVPLDADYNHTLYFASRSAQTAYFGGLQRKNFNPQTYQRVGTNQIRVNATMDDLYEYNYLMFNNGNGVVLPDSENRYENKWFYAFISNVEYVNDNCALITYEIDVMQTFMFDYTLCDCFVEREHSETDGIGEHIEPEPFGSTEMVFNERHTLADYSTCAVIIAVSRVNNNISGSMYDECYSGCKLYAFEFVDAGSVGVINAFLQNYLTTPDEVVNMYLCPISLLGGQIPQDHELNFGQSASGLSGVLSPTENPVTNSTTIDGYLPNNKKLLTYPYNYAMVDNNNGDSMTLRYEFFRDLTPVFETKGSITSPVTVNCYPVNYKVGGDRQVSEALTTEFLSISNYPLCSWSFDSYKIWQARETVPNILSFAMPFAQKGTSGFTPSSFVGKVSDIVSQQYYASIDSDICKGTTSNTGNLNNRNALNNFIFSRVSVNRNQAHIIDDYFTMFGYACNLVKKPNISSRPHWNYVKTVGCQINSSIPNIFANAIRSIYDNGITFWKNASEIGDYSLNNSPV